MLGAAPRMVVVMVMRQRRRRRHRGGRGRVARHRGRPLGLLRGRRRRRAHVGRAGRAARRTRRRVGSVVVSFLVVVAVVIIRRRGGEEVALRVAAARQRSVGLAARVPVESDRERGLLGDARREKGAVRLVDELVGNRDARDARRLELDEGRLRCCRWGSSFGRPRGPADAESPLGQRARHGVGADGGFGEVEDRGRVDGGDDGHRVDEAVRDDLALAVVRRAVAERAEAVVVEDARVAAAAHGEEVADFGGVVDLDEDARRRVVRLAVEDRVLRDRLGVADERVDVARDATVEVVVEEDVVVPVVAAVLHFGQHEVRRALDARPLERRREGRGARVPRPLERVAEHDVEPRPPPLAGGSWWSVLAG
mmetsp:Transcript_27493/g.110125  ORF Transcript_27493/g.110125 Transcript_27493/m.110125 type:complete len:367 (-) Transcript_27493:3432-4532(-)